MTTDTILVTASTGSVGRLLVSMLERRGVAVRRFDRSRPSAPQLHGVDALFLACPNVPEQVAYECALIDAAAAEGVRIVKLSARGAALGSPVAFWDWHAQIERHLSASGVSAVVLRPGFSMANLLGSLDAIAGQGVLPVPGGDARVAMIDPADVAEAAAAALADPLITGSYELTGAAAIGFAEVAAAFTAVLGRAVLYVDVPPEQAGPAMVAAGLPPFAAEQIGHVFAALRTGAQVEVTDDVRRLTGRPARGLRSFLAAALTPASSSPASSSAVRASA